MSLTVLVNAGPWLPVPPTGYGGIETVVATLVPELRRTGVRVVLATVGEPGVEAEAYVRPVSEPRFPLIAAPYNRTSGVAHAHMHGVVSWLRDHPEVDVVHDHLEVVGPAVLGAMGRDAPPTLQTLHWDLRKHADFYSSFDGGGRVAFAAVSQSQLDRAPDRLREQTIGVVPLAVPPPPDITVDKGDHALVLARITRDKGQDVVARACARAGVPLVLAGPVAGIDDPDELRRRLAESDPQLEQHADVRFFVDEVAPLLDGTQRRWIGGVSGRAKEELLQSARVLLAPNRWAEPGATGVVEALGRGVPVVATSLGVLPSLVRHGVTGYLVDDEAALAEHLDLIDALDPAACRASTADWTPAAMAQRYIDLYERMIEEART
ncbi:glycosyltransferase [Luteipulveratus flavus]|uniref:Glycosyltransferase n=1 Tax=Luteipulveratus flavus TaxID=3031728 RepID=A0ABT6CAU8_9MICO|nr:glycosyltransferase [Luteipulveratus sp. YIM 133296]MDF8266011.1 glycosyltransferase [Luteipulveratus sp. YIM 133296]